MTNAKVYEKPKSNTKPIQQQSAVLQVIVSPLATSKRKCFFIISENQMATTIQQDFDF